MRIVTIGKKISVKCMFCGNDFKTKVEDLSEELEPILSNRSCKCGAYFFFDYYYPSVPIRGFEPLSSSTVYHYPIFFKRKGWLVLTPTMQLVAQKFR